VELTQKSRVGEAGALPRKVATALIAQVKKRYKELKNRYGPRYTKGMVAAALSTLFVPIPGISLLAVALVVAVAEIHRAISRNCEKKIPLTRLNAGRDVHGCKFPGSIGVHP
jgi:hypothetical protein